MRWRTATRGCCWAVHHRLTGWQAASWPAEIDVFLAVGELALYVAYLDGWPARQRVWQATMIRRYIIWRNNHAYDERLRRVVDRANIA